MKLSLGANSTLFAPRPPSVMLYIKFASVLDVGVGDTNRDLYIPKAPACTLREVPLHTEILFIGETSPCVVLALLYIRVGMRLYGW